MLLTFLSGPLFFRFQLLAVSSRVCINNWKTGIKKGWINLMPSIRDEEQMDGFHGLLDPLKQW